MEKSKSGLRRIVFIHDMIKNNRFPNSSQLSERLEVSKRTIESDIQYMRDQLGAPIIFSSQKKGYYYSENFQLPPLKFTEEEIVSLFLGQKILSLLKGTPFDDKIKSISSKLEQILTGEVELAFDEFDNMISFAVKDLRGNEAEVAANFSLLTKAIRQRNIVKIKYFTMSRSAESERKVEPYKIHYYDGVWYLIAFCHKSEEFRIFAVDRIREIAILDEKFIWRKEFSLETFLQNSWGVMRGNEYSIKLKFDNEQAKYIKEKKWHASQVNEELENGELLVSFKANSLFEIKKWILGYGKHVCVIEPKELRRDIEIELEEMMKHYL